MKTSLASEQFSLCMQLLTSFFKVGPTTFGGGYAILPAIEREITERRKWLDTPEMSEITAIAGAAPGGIGVNVAAFVGYRIAGVPGLVSAVIGICLPTVLFMLFLCAAAAGFGDNSIVQAALSGIKPTIVALIVYAALRMGKQALTRPLAWSIVTICLLLLLFMPIHPILVLAIGTLIWLAHEVIFPSPRRQLQPVIPGDDYSI
ncbi:chromate transporter [Paenibacillus pasadenensis]|uniref:chromate transporter n=1 Tax=Paenibacillus pasadenensis TaxID=217090 RepID=UPI00203F192F|nr:chromate transporter [Paenibacillus pasadenensis]MCM3746208.1 chromate transporter [Paenibacillus pasadenensis]